MQKREASFTTRFESWLRNIRKETCAWECKVTQDDSFPYRNLADHQETWLSAVANGTAVWKIPDDSIGFKPFDGFSFYKAPAYVVILYKKSKNFYLIPINNYVFFRDNRAKRKSLLETEAREISVISVKLK